MEKLYNGETFCCGLISGLRQRCQTAKVLAYLQTVLNDQAFSKLNQSSIAVAIGLPKGSIGTSVKRPIQDGKLLLGQGKEFKLAVST